MSELHPDFDFLKDIKIGDVVTRMLAGTIPMQLKVTDLTEALIVCGAWTFDRATGVEEDEDIGWGVRFGVTGSYIVNILKSS